MEGFRHLIKGWLGKVLLGLVVLVFTLYGAESLMLLVTKPKPVAQVNGTDISNDELSAAVERRRQMILSQMQQNVNPEFLKPEILRPSVLQQLIERTLLTELAKEQELDASDTSIKRLIVSMDEFQQDGKFSTALFETLVAQAGYSQGAFASLLKQDYTVNQLRSTYTDSQFITNHELEYLMRLQEQTRTFASLELKADDFKDQVSVSEQEIKAYFDTNQLRFQTEEQVKVDYIVLEAKDLESDSEVSEAELQSAYDAYIAAQTQNEQRRASHILISVKADAKESDKEAARTKLQSIQKQLQEKTKTFAELATEFSDDPGSKAKGGDLGLVKKGTFVPPFEKALMALSVNEMSEIVETQFGFHLIQLHEIKTPEIAEFAEHQPTLIKSINTEKAKMAFEEALDQLNSASFDSPTLEGPAEEFDLTLQTSGWLKRFPQQSAGNSGLFTNPKLIKAAFSEQVLSENVNSDIVKISPTKVVVLHLNAHKPATTKPLETVKSDISSILTQQKAKELAIEQGNLVLAELRKGVSLDSIDSLKPLSKKPELEESDSTPDNKPLDWLTFESLKRTASEASKPVIDKVFAMAKPESDDKPSFDGVTSTEGFSIIRLSKITDVNAEELKPAEKANMRRYLSTQLGQLEFQTYLKFHEARSDIEVNL